MTKDKTKLIDIAYPKLNKKPKEKEPTPKVLRQAVISEIEDWMIWIEISKERSNKEFINEDVEAGMLEIIQKQFSEISEIQTAMSRLMTFHSELLANDKYIERALSEIHKKVGVLGEIEKITSKGGRKRNKEVYEEAHLQTMAWFSFKGKKPSANKLSSLVEVAMTAKKGVTRADGNLYLSLRSASNFLRQWQETNFEINRQELVKSFAN